MQDVGSSRDLGARLIATPKQIPARAGPPAGAAPAAALQAPSRLTVDDATDEAKRSTEAVPTGLLDVKALDLSDDAATSLAARLKADLASSSARLANRDQSIQGLIR